MGRHANHEGATGLHDPVNEASASGHIMDDEFAAARKGHDGRAEAQIMTERAHRIDDRLSAQAPIVRQRARIGEQRVVGMHHALGLAGGARGEGEIDDRIRVFINGAMCNRRQIGEERRGLGAQGIEPVDFFQTRDRR